MIPAKFDYRTPATIDEVIALLSEHGDEAKVLAGGHSLIPLLKLRLARPGLLLDLRHIRALHTIRSNGDGLTIGACVTHAAVAESDAVAAHGAMLRETALQIGDLQVRNVGTIGGSVVHADPASDWPAAMLAAGATMQLAGRDGARAVAADSFFTGLFETAARAGELLTAIDIPAAPAGAGSSYAKFAQSASGFALAGVAVQLTLDADRIASVRIGITGAADHAYRPTGVEAALTGGGTQPAAIESACSSAGANVDILEDMHASRDYREQLARVLTLRAVLRAIERARGA